MRERYVALLVVLAAWLLAWLRLPGAARHALWAEDGNVFLTSRLRHGALTTELRSYMGYLHVVPRLLADITVSFVPLARYATSMAALSCLVTAVVAGALYVCSKEVVTWQPARVVLALSTVLVPAMPIEVLGNAANLHWSFLWLAPWLLLYGPPTTAIAVALGALGLAGSLTEIQMALFLPLALYRWSDRRRWWIRGGVAFGVALQLLATAAHPRHNGAAIPDMTSISDGYVVNAVLSAWTGSAHLVGRLGADFGPHVLVVAVLPFVLAVGYGVRQGIGVERIAMATLAAASVVLWVGACVINRAAIITYASWSETRWRSFDLIRYGVVPALCLTATVVLAASIRRRRGGTVAPWLLLGAVLLLFAATFIPPTTNRSHGPAWPAQVTLARARCERAPAPRTILIPVAPARWWVFMPCDRLTRG